MYQAGRGDVHTVLVNGKVVKYRHELVGVDLDKARTAVGATVEYARRQIGEDGWREFMTPEIPDNAPIANPYTYSEYRGEGVAVQHES